MMESIPHTRFCKKDELGSRCKNTWPISDALGPFVDEPLLAAADRILYYFCEVYGARYCPEEKTGEAQNSGLNSDVADCPDVDEVNETPSAACTQMNTEDKPRSCASSIYSSCTNLTTQLSKEYIVPWFHSFQERCAKQKQRKKRDANPRRINGKSENPSWVTAKVTRNGVKSFKIWTNTNMERDLPSVIFIVPPSGQAVAFESVPNDMKYIPDNMSECKKTGKF